MKKTISGIRGIVGNDFTLKDTMYFCNNFSKLIKSKKCVIGRDTRPSGSMIMKSAIAALIKNDVDVYNLEIAPTPVVFKEARKYGAGVIITSSHNPLEWNGLKFIMDGRGVNENELPCILEQQENPDSGFGHEENIISSYLEEAQNIIGNIEGSPSIAIDLGGGAAKEYAPTLLENLGCNVKTINNTPENSTRGPDPTSNNLADLISASNDKDIGFAFDLDGDRLVVVKDGKKQTPDVTLGLGVAKSLQLGFKNFVLSIDSSVAIEKFIKDRGGEVKRSKVGEANVVDLMLKNNAQAGGEGSSGGFILPSFNFCRDGILTSGLIASMLNDSNFNEILKFMESYKQIREKVQVDSKLHDKVIEDVSKKSSKEFSEIITMDGVKGIIDEDSWVLIRKSNTEDIIRISAESNDFEKCKNIVRDTVNLVKRSYDKFN